jgi:hypothetical protein
MIEGGETAVFAKARPLSEGRPLFPSRNPSSEPTVKTHVWAAIRGTIAD